MFKYGIAGDWHGDTEWALACLDVFRKNNIERIIHLGDFGIFGDVEGIEFLNYINWVLVANGQILEVTPGNHDNYVMIDAMHTIVGGEYDGWLVNENFSNIIIAPRGIRWEREGISFVSMGGANSIDRKGRIEGYNWWAGEQISYGDIYRTREGGYADIFVAHEAPDGVRFGVDNHRSDSYWSDDAIEYAKHSKVAMRQAVNGVKPKMFLHGHYHHYADEVYHLTNEDGEQYSVRVVGLDQNGRDNNIGVLSLPDMKIEMLSVN